MKSGDSTPPPTQQSPPLSAGSEPHQPSSPVKEEEEEEALPPASPYDDGGDPKEAHRSPLEAATPGRNEDLGEVEELRSRARPPRDEEEVKCESAPDRKRLSPGDEEEEPRDLEERSNDDHPEDGPHRRDSLPPPRRRGRPASYYSPYNDNSPYDTKRVFVGRLLKGVSADVISRHFSTYGKIDKLLLPEDPATGRSKGFAFITFSDPTSVRRCLSSPQVIDGVEVDCKPALTKDACHGPPENIDMMPRGTLFRTRKLFVGGLATSVTSSSMRNYFARYGSVLDCRVISNRATKTSRGYGFCEYASESSVDRVMRDYASHVIEGKWVQVKRALPASSPSSSPPKTLRGSYHHYHESYPPSSSSHHHHHHHHHRDPRPPGSLLGPAERYYKSYDYSEEAPPRGRGNYSPPRPSVSHYYHRLRSPPRGRQQRASSITPPRGGGASYDGSSPLRPKSRRIGRCDSSPSVSPPRYNYRPMPASRHEIGSRFPFFSSPTRGAGLRRKGSWSSSVDDRRRRPTNGISGSDQQPPPPPEVEIGEVAESGAAAAAHNNNEYLPARRRRRSPPHGPPLTSRRGPSPRQQRYIDESPPPHHFDSYERNRPPFKRIRR